MQGGRSSSGCQAAQYHGVDNLLHCDQYCRCIVWSMAITEPQATLPMVVFHLSSRSGRAFLAYLLLPERVVSAFIKWLGEGWPRGARQRKSRTVPSVISPFNATSLWPIVGHCIWCVPRPGCYLWAICLQVYRTVIWAIIYFQTISRAMIITSKLGLLLDVLHVYMWTPVPCGWYHIVHDRWCNLTPCLYATPDLPHLL